MLRGTTFGRKWRRARDKVGLPDGFRFYDLRHTGNTLAADTGARLKDLLVRAGQSSERAQLIYQHSTKEHQRRLAANIDLDVRRQQLATASGSGGATMHPAGAASARTLCPTGCAALTAEGLPHTTSVGQATSEGRMIAGLRGRGLVIRSIIGAGHQGPYGTRMARPGKLV